MTQSRISGQHASSSCRNNRLELLWLRHWSEAERCRLLSPRNAAIASSNLRRRHPSSTPRSLRSSAVSSGSAPQSISLSRSAARRALVALKPQAPQPGRDFHQALPSSMVGRRGLELVDSFLPLQRALPHPRDKTISYPLHILGIAWQIFAEKIFLV